MTDAGEQVHRQLERDRAVVARALDGHLTAAYQPIVDIGRNVVVGYEALLRYRTDHDLVAPLFSAAELLGAARRVGRTAEVESAALREALLVRDDLPHDTFLSLNVSLDALSDERVSTLLRNQGALDGVVLELSHPDASLIDGHFAGARESLDLLRDRGAAVAIVDPMLHPASLEQLMMLEPGFLKLDRTLVGGLSTSRAKLAVVDSLRHLAEQLGVGVIAQGIEDLADLRSLERLGVTFGQGYLIARPGAGPAGGQRFLSAFPMLVGDGERTSASRVARLIEPVCELTDAQLDTPLPTATTGIEFEVLVTELREPLALLRRVGRRVESLSLTVVDERSTLRDAARVAMRRPPTTRFEPMVCIDEFGSCAGVLRIDRLIDALARDGSADGPAHHSIDSGRRAARHPRRY